MNPTEIVVVEAQLVEHPDYETFVGCYRNLSDALAFAGDKVQEELDAYGDGVPIIKELKTGQYRVESSNNDTVVYFVTVTAIK